MIWKTVFSSPLIFSRLIIFSSRCHTLRVPRPVSPLSRRVEDTAARTRGRAARVRVGGRVQQPGQPRAAGPGHQAVHRGRAAALQRDRRALRVDHVGDGARAGILPSSLILPPPPRVLQCHSFLTLMSGFAFAP